MKSNQLSPGERLQGQKGDIRIDQLEFKRPLQDPFRYIEKGNVYLNDSIVGVDNDLIGSIIKQGCSKDVTGNVTAKSTGFEFQKNKLFLDNVEHFLPIFSGIVGWNNNFLNDIELWGVVYTKDNHAVLHDHYVLPMVCSFVYYVKVPENSSHIEFHSNPWRPWENKIETLKPETGHLIYFHPSYWHCVPPQQTDEERIILSGNITTYCLY